MSNRALSKRIIYSVCSAMLFVTTAYATQNPILFSRASLELTHQHPAADSAPLVLDTEIRDAESAARAPGWFDFSAPGDNRAVMLTYAEPTTVTLSHTQNFAAVDVLFIDEYGTITQIAPKLIMANLEESITSTAPVLAVVYLRGGAYETLEIKPGDHLESPLFRKKPALLTAPTSAPATPVSTPPAPTPLPSTSTSTSAP